MALGQLLLEESFLELVCLHRDFLGQLLGIKVTAQLVKKLSILQGLLQFMLKLVLERA